MEAMASNVGWIGSHVNTGGSDQNSQSLLSQLIAGAYSTPVRVGPW